MKEYPVLIFAVMIMVLFSACDVLSDKSLEKFSTEATIEKTVLYDQNNVKITADELLYGNFSADLSVTIENNSGENVKVTSSTMAYAVNAINGCLAEDGYLNCDVEAGKTVSEKLSFGYEAMKVYGITEIADIAVGFNIIFEDEKNTNVRTEPVKIKTSIADSYDYSENKYQKIISNGSMEKEFESKVEYFSDDILFDKNNICINSAAVITNKDGEPAVIIEIDNKSEHSVYASMSEMRINDKLVYEFRWTGAIMPGKTKRLEDIVLSNLIEKYDGDKAEISKVKKVSFTFGIGDVGKAAEVTKDISIEFPEIDVFQKGE